MHDLSSPVADSLPRYRATALPRYREHANAQGDYDGECQLRALRLEAMHKRDKLFAVLGKQVVLRPDQRSGAMHYFPAGQVPWVAVNHYNATLGKYIPRLFAYPTRAGRGRNHHRLTVTPLVRDNAFVAVKQKNWH